MPISDREIDNAFAALSKTHGGSRKDYFGLLDQTIEEAQRDGTLRDDLPRKLVARAFFGALDEMVTSWILSDKDYDLVRWAAPVVDLFLNGAAAVAEPAGVGVRARALAGKG